MHIAVQSLAVQPVHRLADDGRGGAEDEQTRDGRDPRQLDHTYYYCMICLRELLDDDDCRKDKAVRRVTENQNQKDLQRFWGSD